MKARYLYKSLEKHLDHKSYTIITGARQVGKTTLLRQLFKKLRERDEIVAFINLENKLLLLTLDKNPNAIFDFVQETPKKIIDGKASKRIYILIDEIQYLSNPSNFLKYLYDEYDYNVKIIASGSSAFYIDKKFKDSLAGRKRIFHLYPMSFNEFLEFKEEEDLNNEISFMVQEPSYKSLYRRSIKSFLNEYLIYGGYPAVVLEEDKAEKIHLLNELKDSYLRKDILESKVDKELKFLVLLQLLSLQTGNILNKNSLGRTIGLDNKTVERYVYILQKCFHIDLVKPFFSNLKKEFIKMPKIYFNDLGLRNSLINNFELPAYREDKGMLFENFVYNQLRIKYIPENIRYWRTTDGNEIDFVIKDSSDSGLAIEAKWNCNKFNPKKYAKFLTNYKKFELSCVDINDKNIIGY